MQKMMMRDVVTRKLAGRRKVHCQITMRWLTFQAKANPPTFIVVCVVNSSIIQIISSFFLSFLLLLRRASVVTTSRSQLRGFQSSHTKLDVLLQNNQPGGSHFESLGCFKT